MSSLLLLAALVAYAAAECGTCKSTRPLAEVANRAKGTATQYAMGTPDLSTKKELETTAGALVWSVVVNNVKFLNLPADGDAPLTANKIRVLYSKAWDSCGFSADPITQAKKQIFALRADVAFDLKEVPVFEPAPVETPVVTAVPPRPELPEGPLCKLKNSDIEGRCLDKRPGQPNACPTTNGSPYKSYPWQKGQGEVDDGCRPYPANVQCCALPRGFKWPSPPAVRPAVVDTNTAPPAAEDIPAFSMANCQNSVYDACLTSVGAQPVGKCIDATTSGILVKNADQLKLTTADFPGLSTHACANSCENDGQCINNACVCKYPFGGENCGTRLPTCSGAMGEEPGKTCVSALKFDNIIPGAGQGDTWLIGTRRPISFEVSGYDSVQKTKKVDVYIVNKDANPACGKFDLTNWVSSSRSAYYNKKVGTFDLSTGGGKTFTAKVEVDLAGDACMTKGQNYAIFLESVDAAGEISRDGPSVMGGPVEVAYSSCYVRESGEIGECMGAATCGQLYNTLQKSAAGTTCTGSNICCVPDQTAKDSRGYSWFSFTSPARSSASELYAGSRLHVEWDYDATQSYSKYWCKATKDDQFELQLVRYGARVAYIGARRELVIASYGKHTISSKKVEQYTDNKPGVPIAATVRGETVAEGQYYLMAKISPRCTFRSREFTIKIPSCQGSPTETIVGQCVPSTECVKDNKKDELCAGIAGATCCYATRSGMSAGFREGGNTLEISANAVGFSLMAVVAAFAAQF